MHANTRIKVLLGVAALATAATARADFAASSATIAEKAKRAAEAGASLFPITEKESVSVSFVKLGDDPWRLGLLQKAHVNAPVEKLVRAVDDTDAYVGIFQDLVKSARRDAAGRDDYTLYTETSIPVPFVANDKTSMRYHIERGKNYVLYHFHLVEGNHLTAYDGVALAIGDGTSGSLYWEIDFIEPGYGMNRALKPRKFWVQNAIGGAQSDWALKLKAEGSPDILTQSEKKANALEDRIAAAYDAPVPLETLLAQAIPTSPSANASAKKPRSPAPSTAKPKQSGPKSEPKP